MKFFYKLRIKYKSKVSRYQNMFMFFYTQTLYCGLMCCWVRVTIGKILQFGLKPRKRWEQIVLKMDHTLWVESRKYSLSRVKLSQVENSRIVPQNAHMCTTKAQLIFQLG